MYKQHKNRRDRPQSDKKIHLGTFFHSCGHDILLKIESINIPYPNSPVFDSKDNKIGVVDEVLGKLEEPFCSVKVESKINLKECKIFYALEDKFIYKNKFLSREETEKNKENMDKMKKEKGKSDQNRKFFDRKEHKKMDFGGNGANFNRRGPVVSGKEKKKSFLQAARSRKNEK